MLKVIEHIVMRFLLAETGLHLLMEPPVLAPGALKLLKNVGIGSKTLKNCQTQFGFVY